MVIAWVSLEKLDTKISGYGNLEAAIAPCVDGGPLQAALAAPRPPNSLPEIQVPATQGRRTVMRNFQNPGRSVVMSTHGIDRKSTRLNSSHQIISYAVFCLKKKKNKRRYLFKHLSTQPRRTIRRSHSLIKTLQPSACSGDSRATRENLRRHSEHVQRIHVVP